VNKLFKPLNGPGMTSIAEAGINRFKTACGVSCAISLCAT
jgi:hypothetical protein